MKRYNMIPKCFMALSLILTVTYVIAAKTEMPVRFVVIGDRTGGAVSGIYENIIAEVERMKPDFVITVGDMIEGYTDDTTLVKKQWEEYKTIVMPLSMPIYFTPGNHDIWNDTAIVFYQRYIGKPYYSFNRQGIHFSVLDNSRYDSIERMPKEQFDWLVNDLKKSRKAKYTFVFFHKPFWYETIAKSKTDLWHSLFINYGVDAVFSGHNHFYYTEKYEGILYTAVGSSGGGYSEPGPTGLGYHFTWVTVNDQGISVAPIKMGSVLPWEEVTVADLKSIENIVLTGISFVKPIPVNENLTLADSTVVVKFWNPNTDLLFEDTIDWEIPEGWTVEPKNLSLKIKGQESTRVNFRIKKKAKLYPVPTLITQFPYAMGKNYSVKKPLAVARKVNCFRVGTPPVIDGNISEPIWQKPVTKFFAPDGGPIAIDSAYFYFAYDDDNIYIAAHCKESKIDSMYAKVTEQDGGVYGEDCVGYFFCPDMAKGIVYQIYFNPLGTAFDQKITFKPDGEFDIDRAWNGSYEVKTTKGKNFWSIEARIPVAQLETTIVSGQQWVVNFRRKQRRFNSAADWQVPISYDPKTFGFLIIK
ncbi:MAG: metallophosphoesterase [candidate division WOR-3 bacterium]|nr:metallophosphoesterase [candidate division WOR-3 bacterium]